MNAVAYLLLGVLVGVLVTVSLALAFWIPKPGDLPYGR